MIGPTFGVRLQYPFYFSSSLFLTSYNSLSNTPYFIASCGLNVNINGVSALIDSTTTTINSNSRLIFCNFAMNGSFTITPSDTLTLHIYNITNPLTSTIYAINTDFVLTTYDSNSANYDISSTCSITTVPVAL